MEEGEGLEAAMEREEGGGAEAEPPRGRDKILCYISMQSPGRSSDLDLELFGGADTWRSSDQALNRVVCFCAVHNT